MAEQLNSRNLLTLINELRAAASWTGDIPEKFSSLPTAVKAHLEVVEELLTKAEEALRKQNESIEMSVAPKPAILETFIEELLDDNIRNLARQNDPEFRGQYYGECRGLLKVLRIGEMLDEPRRDQWSADIFFASLKAADQCADNNNPVNDSAIQNIKFQLEQLANIGIRPRNQGHNQKPFPHNA